MRRPLIAAVLAGVLLAGGCGIPDSTEVKPLRQGPVGGEANPGGSLPERVSREDTTNVKDFVTDFLTVAAGDQTTAANRFRQFLSPQAAATFRPLDGIKVIRLIGQPLNNPDDPKVTIKYRDVGTLRQKGVFVPATSLIQQTATFDVGEVNGGRGLYVRGGVQNILLSDTELRFYKRQMIYFWNQERSGLVPDVRYLPQDLPESQRPTEIIDWLTSGPQELISGVVETLPEGTKQIGVVPAASNQTLQISLSGQALPQEDPAGALQRLQQQVRWSLRPLLPTTLALSIEHQDHKYSGSDYLPANPAYQPTEPERFAIYNGQIMRVAQSYRSGEPVPILRPQDNRGIESAALAVSGNRSYAALVVNERASKKVLKVGATGVGDAATLTQRRLTGPVGRPVWAKSPNGSDQNTHGLITMGGRLYSFPAEGFRNGGQGLTPVQWPDSVPASITAVAVAPDAHRVALIAGGVLYVAGLSLGDGGGLQLTSPQLIRTELRKLTAVTWSAEDMLALAGLKPDADRYAIMDVSIDGATQFYRRDDLGSNPVTSLTSQPANPARSDENVGAVAYVIGDAGYSDLKAERMTVDDLAEKIAKPVEGVLPTAPFFLG